MCPRWCAGGAGIACEIARHFEVEMHERTVGKLLARLNFSRVSVRPRHPEQDSAAQEAHKKTSPGWSPRPYPSTLEAQAGRTLVAGRGARRPAGKPDLRLGRQGQPPARAARSTLRFGLPVRRRLPDARRRRRTGAAVRQHQGDEPASGGDQHPGHPRRARRPHPRRRRLASAWRKTRRAGQHQPAALAVLLTRTEPGRECLAVSAQNHLANRVFDTYTAIVDACCDAWNALVARPETITSIATRDWAKAVKA